MRKGEKTMNRYTAAIFDFDGTLADSGEGIINCVLYALHKFGIPEEDRQKLTYFIGPPLFDSFRDLYGVSDADADRLVALYRERYHTKGVLESRLYEGIPSLLKHLRQSGIPTAVCSSKPEKFVREISQNLGILEDLDAISAVSFADKNADKAPLLQKALDLLGVKASKKIAMVGDRHFDMEAAATLGVAAIGVGYGFGSREELRQSGADKIADTVKELETILLEEESK